MPVDVSSNEMEVSSKGSIDSGDSASGDPSTLGNQACPPRRQGAPESQALLTDTSAGPSSQPSVPTSASETTERGGERPPNEEHVGGQHPDAEGSNILDRRVSKCVSNAQKILLSVFEEMMESHDAKGLCKLFLQFFRCTQSSLQEFLFLKESLRFYTEQLETSLLAKHKCMSLENTWERGIEHAFNNLFRIVVSTLSCTYTVRNSLEFARIMRVYRKFQNFHSQYLVLWREYDASLEDEASRNEVEYFKKITEKHLLQTRNAFRELLIHIGENVEDVSDFEDGVLGEDLECLRIEIVRFGEGSSEETDSREGSSEETDSREGSSGGN